MLKPVVYKVAKSSSSYLVEEYFLYTPVAVVYIIKAHDFETKEYFGPSILLFHSALVHNWIGLWIS